MPKIRHIVLGGVGILILVIGLIMASIAVRLSQDEPIPTLMVLPTATQSIAQEIVSPTRVAAVPSVSGISPPEPTDTQLLPTLTNTPTSFTEPIATAIPIVEPITITIPTQPVEDQVVIRFDPNSSQEQRATYIASINGTVSQNITALNTVVVNVPPEITAQTLPPSPVVVATEPDYYAGALIDVPTSDVHYDQQWSLPVIGVPDAWLELPGDAPQVTVAVIDSGVCLDHPDLQGEILAGYDFVQDDSIPQDDFGHGCGVTGIIAANIDNGIGIAGVTPNVQIMPLRVLDGSGIGTYSDVAAGIVYATDNGATIINLSLGGANTSTTLENAIDYAIAHDVLVIAAAGNTGGSVLYPAAYDPVIAVASIDSNLQISSFSSRGPEIDLFAPGRDILTTTNSNSYTTVSGTSFSAPHVAGVAALEVALGNTLTINGGIVNVGGSFIQQPTPIPVTQPPGGVVSRSKVSHDLTALLTEYQAFQTQAQGADVSFSATNVFMPLRNELVVIDASASGDANLLLADLQALGLQNGAVAGYLVSGLLPINSISALPTLDSLHFVYPSYSITNAGDATTQGDKVMYADIVRATYGVDGSGIRIGILSNSFDCDGTQKDVDIASGDLPSDIIIIQDAPCQPESLSITSGLNDDPNEGDAIGQHIHDVAPGASQAFYAPNGQADMATGITSLADAGADVVVDDILFLAEPMFQRGVIAQSVDAVVVRGIPYFTAAGNDAQQSVEHEYRDSTVEGEAISLGHPGIRHNFDRDGGVDDLQSVTIPGGQSVSIQIVLQWDEPFYSVSGEPGSASDLGIYLYDSNGTLVAPLDELGNPVDDNNVGNDPVEFLEYIHTGVTETFQLAIQLNEGPPPTLMKYIYFNDLMTIDEYATNSSTIYGHANAAGAETVGAAFFYDTPYYDTDPPLLEYFSSWGNTPIIFDTSGNRLDPYIIEQKPEIVAPDGGNTTFFGSPDLDSGFDDDDIFLNFFGTSASAPHAAAVAALMLDYDSSLTPSEIYAYMESTAIDIAEADGRDIDDPNLPIGTGLDYASGYGLIDANAIFAALVSRSPVNAVPQRNYFTTDTPTLTWNHVTGAETYEIQVATVSNFAEPIAFTDTVPANTLAVTTSSLENGTYYWRVRALNSSATGPWSAVDSLIVNVP